jgi:outer membrane protein assembly factor BamE
MIPGLRSPFVRKLLIPLALAATQLLWGCSGLPYRIDVAQGNIVTQEMLNRLQPGMSKQQVTDVMGSPMLVDPFHPQVWIYLYRLRPGDGEAEQRQVVLNFSDDRLTRVTGDVRTAPREADSGSRASQNVVVPLEQADTEPSLWERFKRGIGLGDED